MPVERGPQLGYVNITAGLLEAINALTEEQLIRCGIAPGIEALIKTKRARLLREDVVARVWQVTYPEEQPEDIKYF